MGNIYSPYPYRYGTMGRKIVARVGMVEWAHKEPEREHMVLTKCFIYSFIKEEWGQNMV